MRECFEEPAAVRNGFLVAPSCPGTGTTLRADALDRFGVRLDLAEVRDGVFADEIKTRQRLTQGALAPTAI
jgi:hypothetical protein